MVLPSARKLNCPGSNPHLGAFKINLVFLSLLKKYQSLKKSLVRFLYLVASQSYMNVTINCGVNYMSKAGCDINYDGVIVVQVSCL